MKLFFNYCSYGFSNCYILGAETTDTAFFDNPGISNAAIIVDPGNMEKNTLDIIESNNFNVKAVLITHSHLCHVRGLRTFKRIYDVDVYAVDQFITDHKTIMVKDSDKIDISGFKVEVISIPGHSFDSVVYRIGHFLFTGDVLTAGLVGSTASAYGAATQMSKLRSRLLSLPGDYVVLPGHGPPSTLEAERRFNKDIYHFDLVRSRKPVFRVDD